MNTSVSLIRTILISIKISLGFLLLFQISSCDLEVIPAIQTSNIKSNFSFVVQDPDCTANCTVNFTNQSENASTYEWDFGDESTLSNVKDPQHNYALAGTYQVRLKAMRDTVEHDTTIVVAVGNPPVKAKFTFALQNVSCTSNCVVTFTNTSEGATSYEWNFDDASTISTVKDPQHTYTNQGTYNVNLRAIKGMTSHDTTIAVLVGPPSTLTAFKHTVNTTNMDAQRTRMDYSNLNNNQSKIMVVSPVLGVRNTSAIGLYFFSNKWHIFNQNISSMKENEIYNVVVADPSDPNAFVHQTSMANVSNASQYITMLDHPSVNNKPNARVFVTPIWEQATDFNNHPIGVLYLNNRWHIMNLDEFALPIGLKFNVIVNSDDTKSFLHVASVSSISSDYTVIDHVISNSKPNAEIIFTYNQGTNTVPIYNPRINGLWYSSSHAKWTIFNENVDFMQQNSVYNVMVVE